MTTATANRLLPDLGARIWLLVLVNCMANTGSGLILPDQVRIRAPGQQLARFQCFQHWFESFF